MLPTFARHRRRRSIGTAVVIGGLCLALSGLFILNAPDPTTLESILFVAAVCGGICYAAARDATSYWIYAALAPKFYIASSSPSADLEKAASMVTARAPLMLRAVIVALAAAIFFLAMDAWSPLSRPASIVATTVVVYPSILAAGLHRAAPLYTAVAGLSPSARRKALEPRSAIGFLLEDTVVALSINLAIVSPLARREAFASPGPYASPEFLLSHLGLALFVTMTMFVGARRSRLLSAAGEALCGLVPPVALPTPRAAPARALRRLVLGFGVVTAWLFLLAASFHGLQIAPGFMLLYVLLLMPIVGVYAWERSLTLRSDWTRAFELREHLRAGGMRPDLAQEQS